MSIKKSVNLSCVLLALCAATAVGQDLVGVKCVNCGEKQAVAELSVDYKDGKVYFCSEDCLADFQQAMKQKEDPLSIKANHQLVLSGQYEQVRCPIVGKELDSSVSTQVAGIKIRFCCEDCQATVEEAVDLPAKAELVFSESAFARAFAPKNTTISLDGVRCIIMPRKAISEKFSVDYLGHRVFFCCKRCQMSFSENPERYAAKANHQLVATGQVTQRACPFSGKPFLHDASTDVGGVSVKFCNQQCNSKVAQAEPAKQLEMVFGDQPFKQGFLEKED